MDASPTDPQIRDSIHLYSWRGLLSLGAAARRRRGNGSSPFMSSLFAPDRRLGMVGWVGGWVGGLRTGLGRPAFFGMWPGSGGHQAATRWPSPEHGLVENSFPRCCRNSALRQEHDSGQRKRRVPLSTDRGRQSESFVSTGLGLHANPSLYTVSL